PLVPVPARRSKRAMMRRTPICLVLSATVLAPLGVAADSATAQVKRPVTHEALWLAPRVGAPQPSPDGKWVVFPVVEPAYDAKDQVSDLWIVPSDGSAKARRLTSTKAPESDVPWAPDSRRIAFSTT